MQLPRGSVATFSLDFLAADVANWITHAESGISTSKLSLLCASQFQEIADQSLGDAFIRDFRLLVWTTTLAHSAMNSGAPSELDLTCNLALSNLRILVHSYGERVVPHLENWCRPQSLRRLSIEQRKILFLIVIGMCLSATYTPMASEMSSVCRINNVPLNEHLTFRVTNSHYLASILRCGLYIFLSGC